MKTLPFIFACMLALSSQAQDHRFDPPWNSPPQSSVTFTIPGVDNVPDLYGDINDPQLVVFFAGNQFMVVDDLLAAFKKQFPQYQRVFAETLPPGILADQAKGGTLTVGNMRISLKPDIYTAERNRIQQMADNFSDTLAYAFNKLAIMVRKGNPKKIHGLTDLGRKEVRIAMPNPAWEGIGKRIEEAYVKAGGEALRNTIMKDKLADSTTWLTQIHHRQTPMRLLYDQSDAGPVWYSEAWYQQMINHPLELISIPDHQNVSAVFMAGQFKSAPHAQSAHDFMVFLATETAKAIYRKYGFETK